MVFRYGFVSNSSSSSFIVMGDGEKLDKNLTPKFGINEGECEFGWGPQTFYSFSTKANWAFIIGNCIFSYDAEYMKNFITETLNKNGIFDFEFEAYMIDEVLDKGYIDHQSVEDENATMWNSHEQMAIWLLDTFSYIELDNDNG